MKKWMKAVALIACCLISFAGVAESEESDQRRERGDLRDIVESLRGIRVKQLDATVPVAARPLLTSLKHQLRDLIQKHLNTNAGELKDFVKFKASLTNELVQRNIHREQEIVITDMAEPQDYAYGDIYQIAVHRVYGYPDLIAATTTLGICCGSDTSLYLFRKRDQRWDLILAQESNDYEEVSGAQGSFQYAISQSPSKTDTEDFFVVTKNVNPWCSSNWQQIRFKVMRPGLTAYQPKVLFEDGGTIFLGRGYGYIRTESNGFSVEFAANQNLDTGVLIRDHILSYKVEGNRVERIPPFAKEPEGFLDEWLAMPWAEASKWTVTSNTTVLHEWHERWQKAVASAYTAFIYDPPACRIRRGEWQIGIWFGVDEGKALPKEMPDKIYINIVMKERNQYLLESISPTGMNRCKEQ